LDLTWGNDAAVIALIRKIVTREGFGRLLGEGSKKASEVIGKGLGIIALLEGTR